MSRKRDWDFVRSLQEWDIIRRSRGAAPMPDGRWVEDAASSLLPEETKARILGMFTQREDALRHTVTEILKADGHTRTIDQLIASRPDWRLYGAMKKTRRSVQQCCRRIASRIATECDDIHISYDGKTITITT
jgi:hypothetical protein